MQTNKLKKWIIKSSFVQAFTYCRRLFLMMKTAWVQLVLFTKGHSTLSKDKSMDPNFIELFLFNENFYWLLKLRKEILQQTDVSLMTPMLSFSGSYSSSRRSPPVRSDYRLAVTNLSTRCSWQVRNQAYSQLYIPCEILFWSWKSYKQIN